ncbi:Spy/CpxP family protein refolding chaperone [Botryobacter ruber]|uniref:Spy/CpxP family protein refolding chaperone n=1 Tax=Botryobacter ruber TaxID=2171629 RepID=UPI001F0CA125|nr:hypothetical protein [Botryobacter ruber]
MKYYLFFLLLSVFSLSGSAAHAQKGHHDRSNVESAKVAFLTDKMALTPDQAQKFWPLYNEYESKRREIWRANRSTHRKKLEEMSDAEVKAMIDVIFANRHKELDLEQEYSVKFQKIISLQQLALLYRGEYEFPKLLLKKLEAKHPN